MRTVWALLLLCPGVVWAAALDPSVAFVATGGAWTHGGERGHYRILVTNSGWEHVSSTVELQWIVEDPEKQAMQVHKSIEVKELHGGLWSVGQPTFDFKQQGFAFSAHSRGETNKVFLLRPAAPGVYKLESK